MSPTLDSFERELLGELRSAVSQQSESPSTAPAPRRGHRRLITTGAFGGAVAAVVGGVLLAGSQLPLAGGAAFALETTDNGGVEVRIHEFTDASELESALAERGIDATVSYGGEGSEITIDGQGQAAISSDDEPGTSSADVPETSEVESVAEGESVPADHSDACGFDEDGSLPVDLQRDGDDYVITLSGRTLEAGNALRLTTMTDGDTKLLVASYGFADGQVCGAAVGIEN